MMKAIIIEDEEHSRAVLRLAIEQFVPEVEVVGEAEDVSEGIKILNSLTPDILFLDIELTDGTGFDVLDHVDSFNFKTIFITAYDDHAITAIKYAAFDYLLKPLEIDDLLSAIDRVKQLKTNQAENLKFLREETEIDTDRPTSIMIPLTVGYELVELKSIVVIKALANYVQFVLENGKTYTVSHALGYYEELLPQDLFYRIHKSHIVNLSKIKQIEKGRGGNVTMDNGEPFAIAIRRKSHLITRLKERRCLDQDGRASLK